MAQPVAVDAGETDGARPLVALPIGHIVRISLYWMGLTAIDGAIGIFVQNRLNYGSFAVDPLVVGRISFLLSIPVAIISILIQPTVGSISDYTISRWGRRKPYIVFGSVIDLIFLFGMATSNSILMLGAFWALLSVSTNIARGPFQGYVPDLIAEKQVGMASALVGLMQILGNVIGFLAVTVAVLLGHPEYGLVAVAIVELLTMIAVVVRVSPGLPPKSRVGRSWLAVAREAWATDILRERSYIWLLASRLLFLMGGAVLYNYIVTYLKQTFGLDQSSAATVNIIVLAMVTLANLVVIIPSARLSDRIGRKPVIYLSCAIGFAGVGLAAIAPIVPLAIVGAALFGASAGMFLAVDWALMTDIIPRASSGRYMGLSNVATSSATVFAVATGGLVLDLFNVQLGVGWGPRAAFVLGAIYYVLAAFLLRPVVEPDRRSRMAATG
jgi:MFS family permease